MRAVHFDPKDPRHAAFWTKWHPKAHAATEQIMDAWEDWIAVASSAPFAYKFERHSRIWKEFQEYLLQHLFHGKCAYCESSSEAYYPEAEHFRPKRAPRPDSGDATGILADGRVVPHPGYFWLATYWRNLVPSCQKCNKGSGKRDQFPTRKGHQLEVSLSPLQRAALHEPDAAIESPKRPGVYFLAPSDLNTREEPLGLMPLNCRPEADPQRHLVFGAGGTVASVRGSDVGERSIRLYNLRREQLRAARQRAQEAIQDQHDLGKDLAPWVEGRNPHSVAALDYLRLVAPSP